MNQVVTESQEKPVKPRYTFAPEKAAIVLDRIANGESVISICKDKDMPDQSVIYGWVLDYPEFAKDYHRAREIQANILAEQVVEIADTEIDFQIARQRMNARQWYAGKLAPKIYGDGNKDKANTEVNVQINTDNANTAINNVLTKLSKLIPQDDVIDITPNGTDT